MNAKWVPALAFVCLLSVETPAAYFHVSLSGSHTPPFSSWASAATNLQAAMILAGEGDTVLVTNGTYVVSAPVNVNTGVTLKAVNGPSGTVIDGGGAVQCVTLAGSNAVADGFTITGGMAQMGAGVYCAGGTVLKNCMVVGNRASAMDPYGGGVYGEAGSVMRNCVVARNHADGYDPRGGGVYSGGMTIQNCTIVHNTSHGYPGYSAGLWCDPGSRVENTIIFFNIATGYEIYVSEDNWFLYDTSVVVRCCTRPAIEGDGNITADPGFVCPDAAGADYRLLPGVSPCVNAGTNAAWMAAAVDLDGGPRIGEGIVDIGAYEVSPGSLRGYARAAPAAFTVPFPVTLTAYAVGTNTTGLYYRWDFNGDGLVDLEGAGLGQVEHLFATGGHFSVGLSVSNSAGEVAVVMETNLVSAGWPTAFVLPTGAGIAPYTNWATAATDIQSAVDVLEDGGTVLVGNGLYSLTQQVVVAKGITVRSVGGPSNAIVSGNDTTRCFKLTHTNAVVDGLTLTRGYGYVNYYENRGGGVYNIGGTVQNCVLFQNISGSSYGVAGCGGGVYNAGGRVLNCLISSNVASASGLSGTGYGGGVYNLGEVVNCTILGNWAHISPQYGGGGGGGIAGEGPVRNSVIYYNLGNNLYTFGTGVMDCAYSCTTPDTPGLGNISTIPGLDANGRLLTNSACLDAGSMAYALLNDLDGLPRPLDGNNDGVAAVDIGAFERFDPAIMIGAVPVLSPAWAIIPDGSPLTVIVTSSVPASFHYTLNGDEPTEADPVAAGGAISLSDTATLKVRGFIGGVPGPTATGTYMLASSTTPMVSSIDPAEGSEVGGTRIVLQGTNFGSTRGSGLVSFGASSALSYPVWSNTVIECVTPAHTTGAVDVVIWNNSGFAVTNRDMFTYLRSGDYAIGTIGPQSVWHGTTNMFYVHSSELGPAAQLSYSVDSAPAGAISFDAASGQFLYVPSASDKTYFFVTFTATLGTQHVSQTVQINPMPQLPKEEQAFGLVPVQPVPSADSSDYLWTSEVTNSAEYFNTATRNTRTVSVAGRTVVIGGGHANGLYERYNDNANIKELRIYGETVVIRSPLRVPQTAVSIYARELRFEDPTASPACIDTTPQSVTSRPGQFQNGADGARGGDITLHVGSFYSAPGYNSRFIQRGATGQPAGLGQNGAAGGDMPVTGEHPWGGGGACPWPNNTVYAAGYLGTMTDIYGSCNNISMSFQSSWGSQAWPGNGGNATAPGRPGVGGAGGNLASTVSIAAYVVNGGGLAGDKAPDAIGGRAGNPNPAYWGRYDEKFCILWSGGWRLEWSLLASHNQSAGSNAAAPNPASPQGASGMVSSTGNSFSWLSPYALKMIIEQAKTAYLYGHYDYVKNLLAEYQGLIDAYKAATGQWNVLPTAWRLEFDQMQSEIQVLLHRIDCHLDYFGNPAGWVPMLSFEVTRAAFEGEVNQAIRSMYLAYWIRNSAATVQGRVNAMADARQKLKDEIVDFTGEYDTALEDIPGLQVSIIEITNQLSYLQGRLLVLENELAERARQNVEERHKKTWWQQAGDILKTVSTFIPVGQPVVGTIGTAIGALANYNSANPMATFEALKQIPGQTEQFKRDADQWLSNLNSVNLANLETNTIQTLQNLGNVATPVVNRINEISGILRQKEIDDDEVAAELAELEARCPEYTMLGESIRDATEQGKSVSDQLASAFQTVAEKSTAIRQNMLGVDGLNKTIADGSAVLDARALMYIDNMERRAKERLLKYHYYMAKAYEYRMLQPYAGDLDIEVLFNRCRDIVAAGSGSALSSGDFDSLKALYEEQLSTIAADIYNQYIMNRPELSAPVRFNLPSNELARLNAGEPVTVNLVDIGLFPASEENIRIYDLKVYSMTTHLAGGDSGWFAYCDLYMQHSGESKLRRNGQDYIFRHYTDQTQNPITWAARYDYYDNSVSAIGPSAASESLLRSLLVREGISDTADNLLLYSRPAAWADITLTKDVLTSSGADIVIDSLRCELKYDFFRKRSDHVGLELIVSEPAFQPYFILNRADVMGRQDGRGAMYRTYLKGQSVSVTAPEWYGSWKFAKWTDRFGRELAGGPFTNLTLSLSLSDNLTVKANYAYQEHPDMDSDGMPDWWEDVYLGSMGENGGEDSDGDGLINSMEYLNGTDPLSDDSDEDGMRDGAEIIAGVDPTNAASLFVMSPGRAAAAGNGVVVTWPSASNRTYTLWRSTNDFLQFKLVGADMPATPPMNAYTDTMGQAQSIYYRIRVRK